VFNQAKIIKYKMSRGMLLFMASFLLYSLTSPGNLPGDTEIRWSVARQMVSGKGVSVEDTFKKTTQYALGIDGERYSLWNIGQSLCLLPFAGIALALEKLTPIGPEVSDLVGPWGYGFSIDLPFCLVTASERLFGARRYWALLQCTFIIRS